MWEEGTRKRTTEICRGFQPISNWVLISECTPVRFSKSKARTIGKDKAQQSQELIKDQE